MPWLALASTPKSVQSRTYTARTATAVRSRRAGSVSAAIKRSIGRRTREARLIGAALARPAQLGGPIRLEAAQDRRFYRRRKAAQCLDFGGLIGAVRSAGGGRVRWVSERSGY